MLCLKFLFEYLQYPAFLATFWCSILDNATLSDTTHAACNDMSSHNEASA